MAPMKRTTKVSRTTPAATRSRHNPVQHEEQRKEPTTQHEENAGDVNQNPGENGELLLPPLPVGNILGSQPGRRTPEAHIELSPWPEKRSCSDREPTL